MIAEFGEEVGRVGVAVDTLADAEILFDSIPLDKISTSFTINGTAAILLAFYVAAAEKKGVPREKLTGTIQNDILKEYASRGTWIWPPEPSLRLIADTIEFCAAEVPRFNAISVAGAHFRDAGANAVQEMAFTLADGVTYCDTVVERGRMTIDKFAPQISFFFYTHGDFFEEIAKYRAGRRRWATIVRERYGATKDKASMFRFGCVAGGASLYAPQAQNNLVRVAYEALAAVLGGVQSMFTAAWDEPFALPSEESATLALRTQQILAYETGVTKVADPLGGSYFVEALTDATEAKIIEIMDDLEEHGGMVRSIEDGYLQGLIADEAFKIHHEVESGERPVVGVNKFVIRRAAAGHRHLRIGRRGPRPSTEAAGKGQGRAGSRWRSTRRWLRCRAQRRGPDNLMHKLIDCANAYCTVGEMVSRSKPCGASSSSRWCSDGYAGPPGSRTGRQTRSRRPRRGREDRRPHTARRGFRGDLHRHPAAHRGHRVDRAAGRRRAGWAFDSFRCARGADQAHRRRPAGGRRG